MTLKFMDSFETYGDSVDFEKTYQGGYSGANMTFPTTGRRSGTKCLRWDGNGAGNVIPPGVGSMFASGEYAIIGFAFYVIFIDNIHGCDVFLDNGGQGGMTFQFVDVVPTIQFYRSGVSSSSIGYINYELNQWNYLEVKCKIDNSNGHIVVRLNEQEMINWTGDNIYTGPTAYQVSRFQLYLTDDWKLLIDDLYIAGGNGSYNNDFLGDVRIDVINPNGAGNHTDLTPSTGNNYECIDEVVVDESDYVEGANLGEIDSYSYPDVPTDLNDSAIFAVDLRHIAQRTAGSDNIKIDGLLRTGSTDYNVSADLSLEDSWGNKNFVFEKDPSDSGDWTQAKINACEFGMEVA